MKKGLIHTLDSVWTTCDVQIARMVAKELTYTDVFWQKSKFGKKKRREYDVCLLECRGPGEHYFHTGFVPRILKYCNKYGISYEYKSDIPLIEFDEPHLNNIDFREHQSVSFDHILEKGRGVILHATGTGKSIVICGVMSAFSQENILFLVHTQDLVTQMKNHLEKYNIGPVGEWSGNEKTGLKRVMVATIHTFKKMVLDFVDHFDVVLVDETHHVKNLKSMYGYTLQRLAAPVKLGVTATLPEKKKGRLILEALLGPVLAEFSLKEAIASGVLAKPNLTIRKVKKLPENLLYDVSNVPVPKKHAKNRKYKPSDYRTCYWNAIVTNTSRNMQILHDAEKRVEKGKTVLINVVEIEHVKDLMWLAEEHFPKLKMIAVHGDTKKGERDRIKEEFEHKRIPCVVASVVWSEGIDIQSLDVTINAGGGKAKIGLFQRIGRATRKTKDKTEMEVIDYQDTNKYVHKHFLQRKSVYTELGWL